MTDRLTQEHKDIFNALCDRDDIMIIPHRNPDGDALGTAMALWHYLYAKGKRVEVVCATPVPKRLRFLTEGKDRLDATFEAKTVVSVDVATPSLFGEALEDYASKTDFCIDHHGTNSYYAKRSVVLGNAGSSGEVLYRLIRATGGKLSETVARYLYAAISSDTGCFRYANTTPVTLRAVSDLMRFDIPCAEINRLLFDVSDPAHIRLEGYCSERIRTFYDGEVSAVVVPLDLLKECGVDEDDCDGLVAVPRKVEGVRLAILCRERSDGTVRFSLRSETDDLDVAALASRFGGGGHKRAAGCTMTGLTPEEALQRMLEAYLEGEKA